MNDDSIICAIMPSLALPERGAGLRRAIDSVRSQRGVRGIALVIVNGDRFDRALVRTLAGMPDVRLIHQRQADLPRALRAGREAVDSAWFTELDDDDVLLPDALASRLEAARSTPACDAVVSNGYVVEGGERTPHVTSWDAVREDPLRALMRANWLRPGSALFSAGWLSAQRMSGMPRYLEWTYLALRLTLEGRPRFVDDMTFVYHADTPDSLSKSREYLLGHADAIDALLALEMPKHARRALARRRTVACNMAAQACLREGALAAAWRWHLRTLGNPGGWRYLLGTRRFLPALLARRMP